MVHSHIIICVQEIIYMYTNFILHLQWFDKNKTTRKLVHNSQNNYAVIFFLKHLKRQIYLIVQASHLFPIKIFPDFSSISAIFPDFFQAQKYKFNVCITSN